MNDILDNIDRIRRDKGYSQEYVASKIGMKQAGFSLIMSGGRELRYATLLQIANVLQLNVIDLITYPAVFRPVKTDGITSDTTLQIRLDGKMREEVLKIVFEGKLPGVFKEE